MTARERIHLFDTTLRDGAQTTGVDFSIADKRAVAKMLDKLGVDYIEGGYPGANPLDTEFFADPPATRATFTAFGMTKRAGVSISNDPGVAGLLEARAGAICFVVKAWDFHVHTALGCTLRENLEGLVESVAAAAARGREVVVDCEHFFDGCKANAGYALDVVRTAHEAGAAWVVLCDTNGGTLPNEVERMVGEVLRVVPGVRLGIHAHDDTGHAVANSLAAVGGGGGKSQGKRSRMGEPCAPARGRSRAR
jgi:2-isopropylmalate synthase